MGICTSCYSGTTAIKTATVKLILIDGQLREFPSPVKVFLVAPPSNELPNDQLNSFICNADDMDFDDYVTAMSGEEELRIGQLYFELPSSWLKRRLAAEDMASLAVKAGTALMVSGGTNKVTCGCWVKRVDPFVFCEEDEDEMITSSWSRVGGGSDEIGNHRHSGGDRGGGGSKGRMFTRLERIVE